MPEPTAESTQVLSTGIEDLALAHAALEWPPKDDDDEVARIKGGIGVMRRFYKAFFKEVFGAKVDGFGWSEKRAAVAAIVAKEDDDEDPGLANARAEVATLFEDLCDALHGDLNVGYTHDLSLLRPFGEEYFDLWTNRVFKWLTAAGAQNATSLRDELETEKNRFIEAGG